jgi:serine/threonine protein kinase/uncharacterized membrane protein
MIKSNIGQGGFGITYLAFDQKLDQEVCIKELFVSGFNTRGINFTVHYQGSSEFSFEAFVQRFVQEAKQLAKCQHPNIVRVIDVFKENNTAYLAMEYVNGETLKNKVERERALGENEAMSLISQLLDAVEEVHQKGMLHRDIKPDNVLITPEGRVVLIDFGSAREFTDGKTSTQTTMFTPGYAPIEQYSNRTQRGPYTDIYALGATMYFLLTGEKPIPATDRNLEELKGPHLINPEISSQVSSAVLLAMELKPEYRFQSVAEMREAIKSLQGRRKKPLKKTVEKGKTEDNKTKQEDPTLKTKKYKGVLVALAFLTIFIVGYVIFSKFKDSDKDGIADNIEGYQDSDGDGMPNYLDDDSDGDNIQDSEEGFEDDDKDNLPNFLDTDSDGDGILDPIEGVSDIDIDGIPNFRDIDSDGDEVFDNEDYCYETFGDKSTEGCPDSDKDGIKDLLDKCPEIAGNNSDGCFYFEKVTFRNNSNSTIWIAVAYYQNENWTSIGWYENKAYSNFEFFLPSKFEYNTIYWYAFTSGGREWTGEEEFCIKDDAFNFENAKTFWCWNKRYFRSLTLTDSNTEQEITY